MISGTPARRVFGILTTAIAAAFMFGTFAMVGGFGDLGTAVVEAAGPATTITSISVSSTCDSAGGFTGTITLDGAAAAGQMVTLGTFYHIPGNSSFLPTGDQTTVTFATGASSATYAFATLTQFNGANTYRIQVISATPTLGGLTVKSNSVPPCTGTTTTTTTTSTSTTSSTTTTTTSTTTTATTTTGT